MQGRSPRREAGRGFEKNSSGFSKKLFKTVLAARLVHWCMGLPFLPEADLKATLSQP